MPQPLSYDSGLAWDNLTPGVVWDGFATTTKPKRTMASDNRISLEITAAQKAAIETAIGGLKTALDGMLINLTPEEKQSLPRIGDNTLAFDEKCAAYMASRADLVPSFLDTDEMAKDRKLVADLLPCFRELAPLCEGLEDTIMLANSDNMVGDLAFYQNVRQAAKRGVPGANTIYDDLKSRFPGRPKKDPTPPANG
jgi:hypothetical protein